MTDIIFIDDPWPNRTPELEAEFLQRLLEHHERMKRLLARIAAPRHERLAAWWRHHSVELPAYDQPWRTMP